MSIWAKTWAYGQHPKRVEEDGNKQQQVTDKKHPAAKAVLVALAEYPGPGERHCWPSQKTLAEMTDMTDRQVRRCMADLEFQGIIHRKEEHRNDNSRRSDTTTLLGPIEEFGPVANQQNDRDGREPHPPDESAHPPGRVVPTPPDESSGHEPPLGTANEPGSEEKTSFSSGESAASAATPEPGPGDEKTEKAEEPGAYGVRELVERVNAARERGAQIHDPVNVGNYGQFFKNRSKRHDVDTLLTALDYLVAKAAGEIESEKKAWCGFDTALDAVLAGWRPKAKLTLVDNEALERENAELEEWGRDLAKLLQETESANG